MARLEAVTVERVRSMMRGLLAGAQPIWIEVGAKASRRGHDTVLERIGRLGRIAAE